MTIEIGYWNLRGLVGFIRLIAEYTGEPVKWTDTWLMNERTLLPTCVTR